MCWLNQWVRAHYVMVTKVQWKPFSLATQLQICPENDWAELKFRIINRDGRQALFTSDDWLICQEPQSHDNSVSKSDRVHAPDCLSSRNFST